MPRKTNKEERLKKAIKTLGLEPQLSCDVPLVDVYYPWDIKPVSNLYPDPATQISNFGSILGQLRVNPKLTAQELLDSGISSVKKKTM